MLATQKQSLDNYRSPLLWDSVTTVTWTRPKPTFKLVRPTAAFGKIRAGAEAKLHPKEEYCCDRATD